MDKQKQIEEMAKAMCKNYGNCNRCIAFVACDVKSFALRLHEQGYRKQEQGEWLRKQTMIRTLTAKNHICSVCGNEVARCTPYCAECGAEMVKLPKGE